MILENLIDSKVKILEVAPETGFCSNEVRFIYQ